MPARKPHTASVSAPSVPLPRVYSTRLHAVLYSLLLIATPFLLLRAYLVNAIGVLSTTKAEVFGFEFAVVPVVAVVVGLILGVWYRRQITGPRILGVLAAIGMIALAQQITDFYFGHNFYDLQQNWHYIAYGIFAFMLFRDLAPRGVRESRVMLVTSLIALGFSAFDELAQVFLSARVFDVSDIAKDYWGTQAGIVLLYCGRHTWTELRDDWKKLHFGPITEYFRRPATTLLAQLLFGLIFLNVASLFTELRHLSVVILLAVALFVIVFSLWHLARRRHMRYVIVGVIVVLLLAQGVAWATYQGEGIVHQQDGLTIYNGIVIPVFDVLIYPDGGFRLVDKKHSFNFRDQDFFLRQSPDILLVASGHNGNGARGFPDETTRFVYNEYIARGTQVVILKTPDACRLYNRLLQEGKRVLFVLHSTC
ncbi:hypothetical protein GF377_01065 [candidate division GN15 bacterium]|nr:hypothetical protein [candidate division GN15 bacterium]